MLAYIDNIFTSGCRQFDIDICGHGHEFSTKIEKSMSKMDDLSSFIGLRRLYLSNN